MDDQNKLRTDELRIGIAVNDEDLGVRTVTYTQQATAETVLVVFDNATAHHWPASLMWTKATEDEIAAEQATVKRNHMAQALEYVVDLIREHPVAPTSYSIDVSVGVKTIADLQTWADVLGETIRPGGTDRTIPVIRIKRHFGDVRLDLHAQAQEELPAGSTDE